MLPSAKAKYWLLVPGMFLMLSGCTQDLPNVEVCADKGWLGAKCAHTRNGPERQIKKLQWDKERVGYFCMNANSYGQYQKFIADVCAKQQNCIDRVDQFVENLKKGKK